MVKVYVFMCCWFPIYVEIIVGAINCFSCFKTRGWLMDHRHWGVDGCNNFSTDITAHDSAQTCSTSIGPKDKPSSCFTQFASYDQEDLHGVREKRGCESGIRRGKHNKHINIKKNLLFGEFQDSNADKFCTVMGNGCHTYVKRFTENEGTIGQNIQSKWICCCDTDL